MEKLHFEDDFADDIEQEIILQEKEKAEMESDDTPAETSDGVTLSGQMVLDDDEEKGPPKVCFDVYYVWYAHSANFYGSWS